LRKGQAIRAELEREIAGVAGHGEFARVLERLHERFE